MAETEVEDILRQIRERVIAQQRSAAAVTTAAPLAANASANGDSRRAEAATAGTSNRETTAQTLALISSYLTTTERAWDRLPPVISNRSGFGASVELWCKRQMKRATRWYAWEQVNFNAAVHQALRDLLPVLAVQQHELAAFRAELCAELRERDELLREEQRVCFKQVALEASEAATLEDRSRRRTETLLAELQRRLEEIEKKN